jgi:hypothetical protein
MGQKATEGEEDAANPKNTPKEEPLELIYCGGVLMSLETTNRKSRSQQS